MHPIASIALVAAAATLGDFVWYTVGVRHTMTAALVHGALLLTTVGAVLGAASGRPIKGLPIGAVAGIGGALSYFALVAVVDSRTYGTAIPGAWAIMWLLLSALEGRWLRAPDRRRWIEIAGRGGVAAAAGGLAFALVRNLLWGRPPDAERSYLLQFAAWAFAWAPGLLALTWTHPRALLVGGRRTPPSGTAVSGAGSGESLPAPGVSDDDAGSITAVEMMARIDRGDALHIVDVRSGAEFAAGHVPGAVNIPFNQLLSGRNVVPGRADEALFLYCGHGPRAYIAAIVLRVHGRNRIRYISGHYAGWRADGLRIER